MKLRPADEHTLAKFVHHYFHEKGKGWGSVWQRWYCAMLDFQDYYRRRYPVFPVEAWVSHHGKTKEYIHALISTTGADDLVKNSNEWDRMLLLLTASQKEKEIAYELIQKN